MNTGSLLTVVSCLAFLSLVSGSALQNGTRPSTKPIKGIRASFKPFNQGDGKANITAFLLAVDKVLSPIEPLDLEWMNIMESEGLFKDLSDCEPNKNRPEHGVNQPQLRGFSLKKAFNKVKKVAKKVLEIVGSSCNISGSKQKGSDADWEMHCAPKSNTNN